MNYEKAVKNVIDDPEYKKNVEWGISRSGHPEGNVKNHIAELEANLEKLKHRLINEEDYWKLKFLIHVHDTYKVKAKRGVPAIDPNSHESLAKEYARKYVDDKYILAIIQYHDENYFLWKQFKESGSYDDEYLKTLLDAIDDWDLYLAFTIIDGNTEGKDLEKLPWFIREVRKHKNTVVDESWVSI